jgi:GWxTD domain-containing protein
MTISLFTKNDKRKDNLPLHILLMVMFYIFIALVSSSCRYHMLKKKLHPEDADFLSKVRYIITKEEENLFLETPDSEKDKFKQEFWKRRDPDPFTEKNEFKVEYFNRIEKANELFRNEGTPGWLTDRGRIFILFGPPSYRDIDPLGYDYYGRCKEVWQYGNFPVVFVDENCIGKYHLLTYDLSSIRSLNLAYMHDLNLAQEQAQQSITEQERFFDFDWTVEKTRDEPDRIEGVVSIDVPYTKIWLTQREEKLMTSLEVHLELRDSEGKIWWEFEDSFEVELDEENLPSRKNTAFEIEIPFVLDAEIKMLRQMQSWVHLRVRNRTGGDEREKVKEFKHP